MSDFTPHEAPVKAAQALPAMQPTKLIGRDAALAQIYAVLKQNNPVLVHGPSGTGKTAMAVTLANAYAQQPGGVLWLAVNNPTLDELLVQVGRAYQVPEVITNETPTAMIGAVENTLKSSKPFIVIDGTISADVLSRFISRCATGLPLMVANQQRLEGGWAALEVGPLPPEQAAVLLKQEGRVTGDANDVNIYGLAKIINYVPLGLVIAGRGMILSKQSPEDYLKAVQQMANATKSTGTIAAITTTFRGLTGALQGLVLMMGATFKGRASAELLSMISSAPLESVQQAMNILTQLALIERSQRYNTYYYRMHPIVHAFAQASLRGSNRLDELQTKVKESVLAYAQKYSAGTTEAHNRLAIEIENYLDTAIWAAEKDDRSVANQLVSALTQAGDFVTERGYLFEVRKLRTLGAEASSEFPAYGTQPVTTIPPEDLIDEDDDLDEDEDAPTGMGIGAASARTAAPEDLLDDIDEDNLEYLDDVEDEDDFSVEIDVTTATLPQLRGALVHVRQSSDKEREAELLKAIGQQQIDQSAETEAIVTYTELLAAYEELEDEKGILETLDMLSSLIAKTENSQAAVMHATRGAQLAEKLGETETRMHLLRTLGDAHQQAGESGEAIKSYSQALQISRTTDDKQNEAIILYKLGFAQLDDGDPDTAIDTWEQALARFKSQEKRDYEGRVLGGLGSAYGDLERWAEAMNFHTSALYIAREVGDKEEEGLQLSSLAYAATQAKQLGDALLRYRQALHLAYEAENVDNIVSLIVDLVRLLLQSRKYVLIAELLIEDALTYETNDKDVANLKARVDSEKALAEAYDTSLKAVNGTAKTYASNAYRLLDE